MKCNRCHGGPLYDDSQRAGGLDTTTFASLVTGGRRGPGVVAGTADRSSVLMDLSSLPARYGRRHPVWSAAERTLVSNWIAAGAPFDREPVPDTCVRLDGIADGRMLGTILYRTDVDYRTLAPAYLTLTVYEPNSTRVIHLHSSVSGGDDTYDLGKWQSFMLYGIEKAVKTVDVRLCTQFSRAPYGLAVFVGPMSSANEGVGGHLQALDPFEVRPGEPAILTAWHEQEGTAIFTITGPDGATQEIERRHVERGVSRHIWKVTVPEGQAGKKLDYIAGLDTESGKETTRLRVLFQVQP
jgi:hypothetical protein